MISGTPTKHRRRLGRYGFIDKTSLQFVIIFGVGRLVQASHLVLLGRQDHQEADVLVNNNAISETVQQSN